MAAVGRPAGGARRGARLGGEERPRRGAAAARRARRAASTPTPIAARRSRGRRSTGASSRSASSSGSAPTEPAGHLRRPRPRRGRDRAPPRRPGRPARGSRGAARARRRPDAPRRLHDGPPAGWAEFGGHEGWRSCCATPRGEAAAPMRTGPTESRPGRRRRRAAAPAASREPGGDLARPRLVPEAPSARGGRSSRAGPSPRAVEVSPPVARAIARMSGGSGGDPLRERRRSRATPRGRAERDRVDDGIPGGLRPRGGVERPDPALVLLAVREEHDRSREPACRASRRRRPARARPARAATAVTSPSADRRARSRASGRLIARRTASWSSVGGASTSRHVAELHAARP